MFCLNFLCLHGFVTVLKLTNIVLTEVFIKMSVFLILFNFLVDEMTE